MNHINYLTELGACEEGLAFARQYPTLRDAWDACTCLDWLRWIVTAPAQAEYERATAPALAEYERVRALAWAKYERVHAPAWAKYERIRNAAWAEYRRATAPAWAEYERVRDAASKCVTCDELRKTFTCPEV